MNWWRRVRKKSELESQLDRELRYHFERLWSSRFHGDRNILGKSITLDGVPRTVIGVMPRGFQFPYGAELWTPLAVRLDKGISFIRPVVGRLKPGVSPQQADYELRAIGSHLPKLPGEEGQAEFVSQVLPFQELFVADVRKPLLFFAAAVAFVLLIACANVANLLLIRAASRQQEIAVRAAPGARRWRLMRQFLTESAVISLCGGALGLLIAAWTVPGLVALAPAGSIPRVDEIHIDQWVLAFTAGLSILTGLAFGLIPAFHATGRDLRDSLNIGGPHADGRPGMPARRAGGGGDRAGAGAADRSWSDAEEFSAHALGASRFPAGERDEHRRGFAGIRLRHGRATTKLSSARDRRTGFPARSHRIGSRQLAAAWRHVYVGRFPPGRRP
jgi:hypothetical protein